MKSILQNFLHVIRRFKLAVLLNILGLSVAFAAFMVIMIQLDYDFSFDKSHKDYDKIFRLEMSEGTTTYAIVSRPVAERFFESSPHIVAGALTNSLGAIFGVGENASFYVAKEEARSYYTENFTAVSQELFDVFSFDFVEGSTEEYRVPGHVVIPLSLSQKIFGNESAIGKQFIISDSDKETVVGVYQDFPPNSTLANNIYFAIDPDENKDNWGNFMYTAYLRLNDASNASELVANFLRTFDWGDIGAFVGDPTESGLNVRLTALPDIHYVTDTQYDFVAKASRQMLMILFAIALVIIAIAAINFTNFSTALTPVRIKNINTQLVLGAQRRRLRVALVFESMVMSFCSFLLAVSLVSLFKASPWVNLIDADVSLNVHPFILSGTAFVALSAGLLAGLYPARYMTSFSPALVLKGSFGLSPNGRKLRNSLIIIQFIASFSLIIGASFMYLQNHFMQKSPLGYNREALITVDIRQIQDRRESFVNQIKEYSGIADVTCSQFLLSGADVYMKWGRKYKGENVMYQVLPVSPNFLKVMGIDVLEGRDFRQEDQLSEQGAYIFNETAQKAYNLELNTKFEGGWSGDGEIIGFMPDIKFASFRMAVEPMAFYVWGTGNWGDQLVYASIKLNPGTDVHAAVSYLRFTLAQFDAEYPFDIRFYDAIMQHLYEKEASLSTLISLFSFLAILISIVGVFGLVVFDSQSRRKEIGIRKVHGASVASVVVMFNSLYFKIIILCFVVAAPLAWYMAHRWLEQFAYKTPLYGWVYLLAFVAVSLLTICTVTFQNWRVANDNPINSIKTE